MGGQVNCPNCAKLILLPLETTLPRKEKELPPFQPGESFKTEQLTEVICKSVEPYRRDLENKSDLLNDAVEMVKLRNERIKEIETLMLNTQSELWALEAEMDGKEDGPGEETEAVELEELQGRNQELSDEQARLGSRLHHMVEHTGQLDQNLKIHWGMVKSIAEELDAMESLLSSQAVLLEESDQVQEEAGSWLTKLTKQLE